MKKLMKNFYGIISTDGVSVRITCIKPPTQLKEKIEVKEMEEDKKKKKKRRGKKKGIVLIRNVPEDLKLVENLENHIIGIDPGVNNLITASNVLVLLIFLFILIF